MRAVFPCHTKALAPNGEHKMSQVDKAQSTSEAQAVRPFRVNVPEAAVVDLRRRIAATRWPDRETVTDESQCVQLAMIQELAYYWATDYVWRKCEAELNALLQFMTEIDGLDIHFIHVRSRHPNALPLIMVGSSQEADFNIEMRGISGVRFSGSFASP